MAISLTIDGAQVALKKGSSIEYVSENRAFTDADDYSMEIELPLAECPQNISIFGHPVSNCYLQDRGRTWLRSPCVEEKLCSCHIKTSRYSLHNPRPFKSTLYVQGNVQDKWGVILRNREKLCKFGVFFIGILPLFQVKKKGW